MRLKAGIGLINLSMLVKIPRYRPRAIEISGPHKQEYCDNSGLIQGVCILHKYCHVQGAIRKFLLLQTWKTEKPGTWVSESITSTPKSDSGFLQKAACSTGTR